MSRVSIFILLSIGLLLSACGGGGNEDEPPPPTSSPLTEQSRWDIHNLAQRTKAVCQAAVMPAFQVVATQVSLGAPLVPPGLAQSQWSQCENDVTQLKLAINTTYPNGQAEQYFLTQARGFANGIGRAFGVTPQTAPHYFAAGAMMLNASAIQSPIATALKLQALRSLQSLGIR